MPFITPDLQRFQRKDHSQFGEDGVLERIAMDLGIEQGTFFEFGIGPKFGDPPQLLEGNFVALRAKGWRGVFLDGNDYPHDCGVRREFVSALNINHLYRKHGLPNDLDFMSIDVDGQDFWIWMNLQYRPKVMVVEYNGGLEQGESKVIQFAVDHRWDFTIYQGCSLEALNKLAISKSYTLVFANGVNGIFIRDDLVSNPDDFPFDSLWRGYMKLAPDPRNQPWVTI
jgi:hypothetical protein